MDDNELMEAEEDEEGYDQMNELTFGDDLCNILIFSFFFFLRL